MSSSKKKRMSMLDSLASAGAPSPAPQSSAVTPMMSSNRALRSARDAVDGHHVWELDPTNIVDDRMEDRLDPADVLDLRDAIEANGQTVPILVRRVPDDPDRYLLVYGRRRLEAIRQSDKVTKIRALVANLDDDSALRAQISENMGRRDLSYIEKALFAKDLVASGFGTQSQVADILTVTKSAVSMAIAIVDIVGSDLVRAIGPAHGIGRPRWDALGRAIDENGIAGLLTAFLEKVEAENGMLHVSFDVDFLDPTVAPGVGTTVPGGATFREAHLVMEILHDSGLVTSLDLVELNPFLDERGKAAILMTDLTASLFGRRVMDRPTRSYG